MSTGKREDDGIIEQREVPGVRHFWNYLGYAILVLVVGTTLMLGFSAFLSPTGTQRLMDTEMAAVAVASGGRDSDAYVRMEKRATWWGETLQKLMPVVPEGRETRMSRKVDGMFREHLGGTPQEWWNGRMLPNVMHTLPVVALRLEILAITLVALMPLLVTAFFFGERRARELKRQGIRPGDHWLAWTARYTGWVMFASWIAPFLPLPVPVVTWLAVAYVLTWFGVFWVRSNAIEI